MSKEAKQAWKEKCTVTSFKILSSQTEDRSIQIIEGSLLINELLSAYKASLKDYIYLLMSSSDSIEADNYNKGLMTILNSLDFVPPLNQ